MKRMSITNTIKSEGLGYVLFKTFNYIITTFFVFICVYPFYYVFIYSISDPFQAAKGILFIPQGFCLDTYGEMLRNSDIYSAFFVSLSRAVLGTFGTIICSSMFAYIISRKETYFRKILYRVVVSSMYLNAGLIPWYLTMKAYGLKDNYLLYILPYLIGPFYVILIKAYMESLPESIEEAAKIDGASAMTIFFKVILPVCLPIIATIGVFSAVGQWNYWVDNYFLVNDSNLQTLQMILYNFLTKSEALAKASRQASSASMSGQSIQLTSQSIKMCTTIITTLPILIVYPMMQKHFIKGIMIGAVKG